VARLGIPSFGLGGSALGAAGTELCADLSRFTAMGIGAVLMRAPEITHAAIRLLGRAQKRKPDVALLVGYSEFNRLLGPWLRRRGVRVLWYGAPQVWAWRSGRAGAIARACDRMAVILPFEQALWRGHQVDAHYVGHPALERPPPARAEVRKRYGLTPYAEYVAVLPGSRPHEVERHLQPMLLAVGLVRAERGALDARLILSPALPAKVRAQATARARAAGVAVLDAPAPAVLPAFDAALAASGTVTLECAVAGVPPVIVYQSGAISYRLAKRLVRTPHIALPNIVLREPIFPELIQERVTKEIVAAECTRLLEAREEFVEHCRRVRRTLRASLSSAPATNGHSVVGMPIRERPSERVARLIEPWLT
jgi:lipid-A-disaccharide synthase